MDSETKEKKLKLGGRTHLWLSWLCDITSCFGPVVTIAGWGIPGWGKPGGGNRLGGPNRDNVDVLINEGG